MKTESQRILNNAFQRERQKTPKKAATIPSYGSDSVQSQENDVEQVGKKFSALGQQLAISLDEEDSTNLMV